MDPASWDKAKDVIFEALELAPVDREAFVRQRCDDSSMCVEILAMLAGVGTRDEFLASQPVKGVLGPVDENLEEADALELGTKVGPYLIVDRIGRGGMGQVFLATDPRLRRRVALKCLLDSHATGADVRSRILHEARAAARIDNPHVAVVHDVIEHDTRAFIVMEYVEGENLAARLKRERLPVEQAVVFGQQLASALAAAHAEQIVHRDLKPENIQVTPAGSVKVLDFGIANAARLLSSAASGQSTTSPAVQPPTAVHDAQPGTPPYMSPEQLLGRRVDQRSDIYSLGVVLFEMCTGQRPYPGKQAFEIAAGQAKGVPRADATGRDVPRPLADVIARAMAINVEERYQTAIDVGSALEEVERTLKKAQVNRPELIRRWLARIAVGVPTVILALGVIGFITSVQFNFVFGRYGRLARFGVESWSSYVGYGLLGVAPVLFIMTFTAASVMAARFALGLLELIGPIGRLARRVRAGGHNVALAIGLDQAAVLAQALTGLGIATLAVVFWHHADLVRAWSSFFNSSPIEMLLPMTDSAPARNNYQIELSIATLALSFGLYKVIQLRTPARAREGRVAVALLTVVIAVMVLMNEVPYRTFHKRDLERVDLAGARCYINGESGDEFLILCPGSDPPRNRTVRRDDPQLHRLGIFENVFKGVNPGRSVR